MEMNHRRLIKKTTTVSIYADPVLLCDNCVQVFPMTSGVVRKTCPHCGMKVVRGNSSNDGSHLILGDK